VQDAGSAASTLEGLGADAGLDRVARALASAAGFSVHVVTCPTPRLAEAALAVVMDRVAGDRGAPPPVVRLDPYEHATTQRHAIAFDVLVRAVLARLFAPESAAPGTVVVVDASRALPEDDAAWAACLRRVDAARDLVAESLRGPLLLLGPERVEALLATAAPNLWALRGASARVDPRPSSQPSVPPAIGGRRSLWPSLPPVAGDTPPPRSLESAELEAGLAEARARLERSPDDPEALADASAWLHALVRRELAGGSVTRALALAEARVDAERRLAAKRPDDVDQLLALAVALDGVGDARAAQGDLDRAAAAYDEALGLRRRAVARDHAAPDPVRALAVSLDRVGRMRGGRGDREGELAAYEEALAMRRHLAARGDAATRTRDVVVSLDRVGDVWRARGDADRALAAYVEALALARRFALRAPADAAWQRALAATLDRVGDLRLHRGELDGALAAFGESLGLRRHLAALDPRSIEASREVSNALGHLGDVHAARGDLARALVALDEETGLARALCARDPGRAALRHDLAVALARQARLAEARGRRREARLYWAEAEADLAALARAAPVPPAWSAARAACAREVARLDALLPFP
jgi:tetratricopeptide (TPR) repeat protein